MNHVQHATWRALSAGLVFFGSLALQSTTAAAQSPPPTDRVLIEIGGESHTLGDFLLYLRQINPRIRYWELPASEQQKHLDSFVERKLWAREARRLGLDDEPETRARIDFFTDGTLATGFKGRLQDQIEIETEEIEDHYARHLSDFRTDPRYHLQHLLYRTPEEALAARKRWSSGGSFQELAKQRGEANGPVLAEEKWFTPEILLPELLQAAERLGVCEITQGVYSNYGYHLLKLVALEPSRQLTLQESTPRIEVQLRRIKASRLYAERLEQLKKDLAVRLHLP